MANEVNIYTPRYLAEVVRQAPPVHTFFRDTFFTNVKKSTTERVDIDLVKGDRRMAAFVHPRVGGKVLKASGYKTESYKPPLVNPCDITTADRYMTRMPGEDLYSGETPAQRSAQQLMEEYSRLIQEKPAYGQIICRCESVTEGEIMDAIHRPLGARSLDGIKRRTRAGMGRCQAGFCSPKVMDILARELGLSLEEITKSGGRSNIVLERTKEVGEE